MPAVQPCLLVGEKTHHYYGMLRDVLFTFTIQCEPVFGQDPRNKIEYKRSLVVKILNP